MDLHNGTNCEMCDAGVQYLWFMCWDSVATIQTMEVNIPLVLPKQFHHGSSLFYLSGFII